MRQIALPIDALRSDESASLIVTSCNDMIVKALDDRTNWPGRTAILTGPPRSGKSVLARYFASSGAGEVIDDADGVGDESLFNSWNRAQQQAGALLLVSRLEPARWRVELADLKSRLSSALHLEIAPPDDEMVTHLLQKHLHDRGAAVTPELLAYVTKRIARDYEALEKFARELNALALSENRSAGLSLARKLLAGEAP